jgi:hypothetical protein
MLELPKCGECSIYPNLFCPYKDFESEHCAYAPLITEMFADIMKTLVDTGYPLDMQEICARHIPRLCEELSPEA